MTDTPNPGSDEAIKLGCTCPVIENHYGRGRPYRGGVWWFWKSDDCPVHGNIAAAVDEKRATDSKGETK